MVGDQSQRGMDFTLASKLWKPIVLEKLIGKKYFSNDLTPIWGLKSQGDWSIWPNSVTVSRQPKVEKREIDPMSCM